MVGANQYRYLGSPYQRRKSFLSGGSALAHIITIGVLFLGLSEFWLVRFLFLSVYILVALVCYDQ